MSENNYVVRTRQGQFWTGKDWVCCNVCALRMTREEAHRMAHVDRDRSVRRVAKRKASR